MEDGRTQKIFTFKKLMLEDIQSLLHNKIKNSTKSSSYTNLEDFFHRFLTFLCFKNVFDYQNGWQLTQ